MNRVLQTIARSLGLEIVSSGRLDQLRAIEADRDKLLDRLQELESDGNELLSLVAMNNGALEATRSQLKQDIFVLLQLNFKRNGYFVEFGATNGVDLSNTYLLEKQYGWTGILAEPATVWHEALKRNRASHIETDCVWSASGKTLDFNMVGDPEFSTISAFNDKDSHSPRRRNGNTYQVRTVSLHDLLTRYDAPKTIDYLSIDTEGSEYDILSSFDFDKFNISIITCEHNYTDDRDRIFALLSSKGYVRRFAGLSRWDDWYVRDVPPAALK